MAVVQLPVGGFGGSGSERGALRAGVAGPRPGRAQLRLMEGRSRLSSSYCSTCASPIELGAVTRGREAYCSIECSLGGDRPA